MIRSRTRKNPQNFSIQRKNKIKQKNYNQTEKQKRRIKNRRQRNTENSQRILLRPFDSDANKRTRTKKLSQQIQQKNFKRLAP